MVGCTEAVIQFLIAFVLERCTCISVIYEVYVTRRVPFCGIRAERIHSTGSFGNYVRGIIPILPVYPVHGIVHPGVKVSYIERRISIGIELLLDVNIHVSIFQVILLVYDGVRAHKEYLLAGKFVFEYHTHPSTYVRTSRPVGKMVVLRFFERCVGRPEVMVGNKFEALFVIKNALSLTAYTILTVRAEEYGAVLLFEAPGKVFLGIDGEFLNSKDVEGIVIDALHDTGPAQRPRIIPFVHILHTQVVRAYSQTYFTLCLRVFRKGAQSHQKT